MLTMLLFFGCVVLAGVSFVCWSERRTMREERDDAVKRARQAETSAQRVLDAYSEKVAEQKESRTPTVRRLRQTIPPPPAVPRPDPKRSA